MKKTTTLSFGMLTLAVFLLSGCSMKNDTAAKTDTQSSFIKLQAEDASLINACTEVAEHRLLSNYPQIDFSIKYEEEGTSVISFDADENWDDRIIEQICSYGSLTFRKGTDTETDVEGNKVPTGEIVLENSDISEAEAVSLPSESGSSYAVSITMTSEGSDKFAAATQELAGSDTPLSVWFDGELISSPTVSAAITNGQALITGNFDINSANELANAIDSGAMPCGVSVIDHRIIIPKDTEKN